MESNGQTTKANLPIQKTEKVLTAIYLVTDLFEDKPLQKKIRENALELVSVMRVLNCQISQNSFKEAVRLAEELNSCLNLAATVGFVSVMNGEVIGKVLAELIAVIRNAEKSCVLVDVSFMDAPLLLPAKLDSGVIKVKTSNQLKTKTETKKKTEKKAAQLKAEKKVKAEKKDSKDKKVKLQGKKSGETKKVSEAKKTVTQKPQQRHFETKNQAKQKPRGSSKTWSRGVL